VTALTTLTATGFGPDVFVRDSAGNLYGSSVAGGSGGCYSSGGNGCGIVFELDANGNETVLYSFTGGADGGNPTGGMIRDPSGNLYGTASVGGAANVGVVFKVESPTGTFSPCDLKQNGNINVADVQLVINEALGVAPAVNDLNEDGSVNVADVQIEINAALGLGCAAF
jgi:uncharacterized repeat protein (TIGR03803 family)